MRKIKIVNTFHNTQVEIKLNTTNSFTESINTFTISKYAYNKLCGINGCLCDHNQFYIGNQRVYVSQIKGNRFQVIHDQF